MKCLAILSCLTYVVNTFCTHKILNNTLYYGYRVQFDYSTRNPGKVGQNSEIYFDV